MLLLLVILFYLLLVLAGCIQPALHVAGQTVPRSSPRTLRLTAGELQKIASSHMCTPIGEGQSSLSSQNWSSANNVFRFLEKDLPLLAVMGER